MVLEDIIVSLKIGQPMYPIILVGGTNGKGSVCAYLTTILTNAGYKVGTFTSPHVLRYNERIAINNHPIDDVQLAAALNKVIHTAQAPVIPDWIRDPQSDIPMHFDNAKTAANMHLGLFQAFTLAAHLIFKQQNIDIAIVEVGIGGTHDITNLFEPSISAITNVDYDHMQTLGNTIEEIAANKAGIFRSGKPGFFGNANIPNAIVQHAQKINAPLECFGVDFGILRQHDLSFDVFCRERNFLCLPYPALRGTKQPQNVALALAILSKLQDKFPVSLGTIKSSLLQTKLLGRFQVLPGLPQTILDVAHNPHAVTHMLQNMLKLPFAKRSCAVFGIANDKDVSAIIDLCHDRFDIWFIAAINSTRALDIATLQQTLLQAGIPADTIITCATITEAYTKAQAWSTTEDRIIAFGSFLVVEDITQICDEKT